MQKVIPVNLGELGDMALNLEKGVRSLTLDIRHHTADIIAADRSALFEASYGYVLSRIDLKTSRDRLETMTQIAQDFVCGTRDTMKLRLGKRYSMRWEGTGFEWTLEAPRTALELAPLVMCLGNFLSNNSSFEVSQLNLTAARAAEVHRDLLEASTGLVLQRSKCDQLLAIRNEKAKALRKRIRGLINELEFLIDDDDPRWTAFGLNMPATVQRPETPEKVEVKVVNNEDAYITWEVPARAERYRVFQKMIGVDPGPVYVGTVYDPNFVAEELPRAATIEFTVIALNDGGESAPSAVVMVKIE